MDRVRGWLKLGAGMVLASAMLAGQVQATPFEDYQHALDLFMGGYATPSAFQSQYAQTVLNGIDGRWVELNLIDGRADPSSPQPIDEAELTRACGMNFVSELERLDALTFLVRRAADSDTPVETRFQAMGGSRFAYVSDVSQVFGRMGFDPDLVFDEPRMDWVDIMTRHAGVAQIFAPGDDVRVVIKEQSLPLIMVRCVGEE